MNNTVNLQDKPFGLRLREARKSAGKTQQEFADLAGVHVAVWGGYERGTVEPGIHKLKFLIDYDISLGWLLTGEKEKLTPEQEMIGLQGEAISLLKKNIEVLTQTIELLEAYTIKLLDDK